MKLGGLMNNYEDVIKQATPPVTVSTLSLLNVQLSDWVYILTIIYLLLQIAIMIRKMFRK